MLGNQVSNKGLEVDKAKIEVIKNLPLTNLKQLKGFLGHVGFYKRFIKNFVKISKPLINLVSKDVDFIFDSKASAAFLYMKEALIYAPILQSLNWDLPFELMCDASNFAIRVILGQRVDRKLVGIYYVSKTLGEAQLNYLTI